MKSKFDMQESKKKKKKKKRKIDKELHYFEKNEIQEFCGPICFII